MIEVLPLLAAAGLVGAFHMSAPDHWVTLCVLGKAANWSQSKLLGLGVVTASGHVLLSVALGFLILGAGLLVSAAVSAELILATGGIMVVAGLAYAARSLASHEHAHLESGSEDGSKATPMGLTYYAVLGAALSPDLAILPIFVLAIPVGIGLAVDAAVVFAASSILTLTALLVVGSRGLAGLLARVPEKYNDALIGFVVAAVGVYVLAFG